MARPVEFEGAADAVDVREAVHAVAWVEERVWLRRLAEANKAEEIAEALS